MELDSSYLNPPRVYVNPGAEHGAAPRAFQGISSLACGHDGRLWAVWYGGITPAEDHNNYVILAVSTDDGRTWSTLTPSSVPHVKSRFFIRRLNSGRLLLVRHDPENGDFADGKSKGSRSHLKAYLTDDDGATWQGGLLLDERTGVSYPDGDQTEDDRIVVTYDFDRKGAREILMAAFAETDVVTADAAAYSVRLRVLINKAGCATQEERTRGR